jgi:RNA polymerase sigma-70 factor (ECF subfamily)
MKERVSSMSKPVMAETTSHEAFLQQFMRNERSVRAYLRALLASWEEVDEAMQETSMVAWRKYSEFDPSTNFGAWLAMIARFEALKLRRSKRRDRLVFSDGLLDLLESEGIEELERLEGRRRALEQCIGRLGESQRQLLQSAYGSGLTLREVAVRFGRSVDGFYKSLQRLRTALLRCSESELEAER